jgi:hypothetical protein
MLPQLEANNVRLVGIGTKINPAHYLSMLYMICFVDIDIACFLEQKAVETIYYALTSICNEEEEDI